MHDDFLETSGGNLTGCPRWTRESEGDFVLRDFATLHPNLVKKYNRIYIIAAKQPLPRLARQKAAGAPHPLDA